MRAPQLNIEVPFDPNGDTAIFAKYAERNGKKFSRSGIAYVTASSNGPSDVTDVGNDHFATKNEPNSYIEFYFPNHEINPTGYVIKTLNGGPYFCHLKNWKFEGSKDGNKWDLLDSQSDNYDLNGKYKSKSFEIANCTQKYSHFRLTQTGKSHRNEDYLVLSYFDIFGKLFAK